MLQRGKSVCLRIAHKQAFGRRIALRFLGTFGQCRLCCLAYRHLQYQRYSAFLFSYTADATSRWEMRWTPPAPRDATPWMPCAASSWATTSYPPSTPPDLWDSFHTLTGVRQRMCTCCNRRRGNTYQSSYGFFIGSSIKFPRLFML